MNKDTITKCKCKLWDINPENKIRMLERAVELRGVAFMTVLAVLTGFGGSGTRLALLSLILQNTGQRGNHEGFDSFGGCDGLSHDSCLSHKLNPLFRHPDKRECA